MKSGTYIKSDTQAGMQGAKKAAMTQKPLQSLYSFTQLQLRRGRKAYVADFDLHNFNVDTECRLTRDPKRYCEGLKRRMAWERSHRP